jgi:diguanylate cyclase
MTTLKYLEPLSRSKELLKQVISFIGAHRLSANPINYTVCYEYLHGTQPALTREIEKNIAKKIQLTDQIMQKWFDTFLSDDDDSSLKQSQSDLDSIISKLAESTSLAEENVNQFSQTLSLGEKELVNSSSSPEAIVSYLLLSTRSMQASMEEMRQEIQESKQEINSLQDRLKSAVEEALSDPLTGLINRKGLSLAIESLVLPLETSNSYPCLLMLDIDHFKKINDTFGHPLGDRVIKVVADILKSQIKGKDTAARYGGEEFCILLPETELSDAAKVAENIRQAIENSQIKRASDNQIICRMTISIGVARYQPNETILGLFERADGALYQSKNEGRNRVTCTESLPNS